MPDPWVAVDATIGQNAKLAHLPNDSARWGWVCVMGAAKMQRPGGQFQGRRHFKEVAGRFGRFLDYYVGEGLIEEAPELCDRCRKHLLSVPHLTLVIHDWHLHQRDPGSAERAKGWRDSKRGENAERTQDERSTNKNDTEPSRALSVSLSEEEDGVGGAGGGAALQDLAELLTQQPYALQNLDSKFGEIALRQLSVHGYAAVEKAWRTVAAASGPSPTIRQIVLGADNLLFPVVSMKTVGVQERAEEAERSFDERVAATRKRNAAMKAYITGEKTDAA